MSRVFPFLDIPARSVAGDLSSRNQIDYIKSFLWRKYKNDLPGLKAYADGIFASAVEEVTLTTTSFEGGSAGGQVKFNVMLVGIALEELITAVDPAWTPPPRQPLPDREISLTVNTGL